MINLFQRALSAYKIHKDHQLLCVLLAQGRVKMFVDITEYNDRDHIIIISIN